LNSLVATTFSASEEWKGEAIPLVRAMATRLLKKFEIDMKR
jgi:hypothetical protein